MNDEEQRPNLDELSAWSADVRAASEALVDALQQASQLIIERIPWLRHELQRQGVIDGYPPQHNYRQTKRGRVPRLSPAMRAKKRELRERRGR